MLETLTKNEAFEYQKLSKEEMASKGILGRLIGPCADFLHPTRNGRGYTESLWENVFNDDIVKEKIANKCLFGELGHPLDREEVDLEKIALALNEQPKKDKDGKLIACFDILDTPNGRILKTLCDYGTTIGISSRGTGDVISDDSGEDIVDPDTYQFECFDAVIVPAVKEARLNYVTESLDTNIVNMKKALREDLNNASEEDKKVMSESLNQLGINLDISDTDAKLSESLSEKKDDILNESKSLKQTTENPEEANNDGSDEIIKSLKEALKTNAELELRVKSLQEELAVSDTKVTGLEEDISKSNNTIVRLTSLVRESKKLSRKVSTLEEELKVKNQTIENLRKTSIRESKDTSKALKETIVQKEELIKTKVDEINSLTEQLNNLKNTSESEISSLKESLEAEKSTSTKTIEKLKESLNKSQRQVETYRKQSNAIAVKYIATKSKLIGSSVNEVMSRLPDDYTLEDVDKVCEDLKRLKISKSRIPFELDKGGIIKVNESKNVGMLETDITSEDDYVSDDLKDYVNRL